MYELIITEDWTDEDADIIKLKFITYKEIVEKAEDFVKQGYDIIIRKEG